MADEPNKEGRDIEVRVVSSLEKADADLAALQAKLEEVDGQQIGGDGSLPIAPSALGRNNKVGPLPQTVIPNLSPQQGAKVREFLGGTRPVLGSTKSATPGGVPGEWGVTPANASQWVANPTGTARSAISRLFPNAAVATVAIGAVSRFAQNVGAGENLSEALVNAVGSTAKGIGGQVVGLIDAILATEFKPKWDAFFADILRKGSSFGELSHEIERIANEKAMKAAEVAVAAQRGFAGDVDLLLATLDIPSSQKRALKQRILLENDAQVTFDALNGFANLAGERATAGARE